MMSCLCHPDPTGTARAMLAALKLAIAAAEAVGIKTEDM